MRLASTLSGILVILSSAVSAEPNPTTNYLMNEPVSMFTYGIDKIDKILRDAFSDKKIITSANYEWNLDRIILLVTCWNCGMSKDESSCVEMIEKVRIAGCVQEGRAVFGNFSCYSSTFSQNGYSNKNRPENLAASMDQKFAIRVSVVDGTKESIVCEAPLLGKGYSVKK